MAPPRPLDKVAAEMIGRKLITQAEVDALRQRCKDVMKDVAGRLTEAADGGKRRVRADLWPSPDFRDVGLRSTARNWPACATRKRRNTPASASSASSSTPSPTCWTAAWKPIPAWWCWARTCTA